MVKSFHICLVRPFFKNLRKELTKMPKIYFMDLGLKNFFLKNFEPIQERENPGPAYENLIFRQFIERTSAEDVKFWRTQSGNEVDFILNNKIAYEVKYNISNFSSAKYKVFLNCYKSFIFNVAYHAGSPKECILKNERFNFIKF